MFDMKDLTACNSRSEQEKAEEVEDEKKNAEADSDDDDGFADFQGEPGAGYTPLSDDDDEDYVDAHDEETKDAKPEGKAETGDDKIIGALNRIKLGNPEALNAIFTDDA